MAVSQIRISESGVKCLVGCWGSSLPARKSGEPEFISGAGRLICRKAIQVDDQAGIGATQAVVELAGARVCVGVASLPARQSGKPESVNSDAGGLARSRGQVGDEDGLHTSSWCRLVIWLEKSQS